MAVIQRNLVRQDLHGLQSRPPTSPLRPARRAKLQIGEVLILVSLMVVGLIARLDFLLPNNFVIDADEAIVGLMAKHILEGHPIPVFYYGQNYMGSFEPILVSILFKFFGVSNVALKAVPLIFSLLLIPLAYSIGRHLGGKQTARFAAVLMTIPPAALTIWSAKARGGFIELVFIGALATLVCIRWLKQRDCSLTGTITMGLLLGFGWWVNNQIIFFMIPLAFAILSKILYLPKTGGFEKIRAICAHALSGLFAFFVGGMPFWIYNLEHDFVSFQMFTRSPKSDIADHVAGLFSTSIPIIFGAKHFWESNDIFPGSSIVAYGLYGAFLIVLLAAFGRDFLNLFRLKLNNEQPVMLLLVFLGVTAAVFVTSSFGHLVQAPRYLLPAYVALVPLAALALHIVSTRSKAIGTTLFCGLLAFNVASSYVGGRAVPGEPIVYNWDRVARDHTELINWLHDKGYHWIRTNYWIGYRLAFETQEDIKFVVFQEPHHTRIESYRQGAKAVGEEFMPLVLSPTQTALVESAMTALGYRYSKIGLSGYQVLYDISLSQSGLQPIEHEAFDLHSSSHDESAAKAADNDLGTRWGSGEPQKPGMEFVAEFHQPQTLRGLRISLGDWETDFPRGLRIEAELANGEKRRVFDESQYGAALYFLNHNPTFSLVFPTVDAKRIIFTQTGRDPLFDWSIAEIELER
ncbi:MAG: hypothetical protein U0136_19195 [Bdellovibrionota bacterium]